MTARLQQSSILDWAQSQHQSAASGTGMDSSRAHYRPSGPGPSLGDDVWVLCNRIIRVLVPVLMIVHMHRPWPPALQTIASWERPHFWSLYSCSPSVVHQRWTWGGFLLHAACGNCFGSGRGLAHKTAGKCYILILYFYCREIILMLYF